MNINELKFLKDEIIKIILLPAFDFNLYLYEDNFQINDVNYQNQISLKKNPSKLKENKNMKQKPYIQNPRLITSIHVDKPNKLTLSTGVL